MCEYILKMTCEELYDYETLLTNIYNLTKHMGVIKINKFDRELLREFLSKLNNAEKV